MVRLHGSLNVPIEHHPTIRYMVYNGYYKVMSNIPKMGQLPTPGLGGEKANIKMNGIWGLSKNNQTGNWIYGHQMIRAEKLYPHVGEMRWFLKTFDIAGTYGYKYIGRYWPMKHIQTYRKYCILYIYIHTYPKMWEISWFWPIISGVYKHYKIWSSLRD